MSIVVLVIPDKMFGDDSFMGIEDLFNQFSGTRKNYSNDQKAQSQNLLNTVESEGETILIFDLSGRKVVSVTAREGFLTNEYGERIDSKERVMAIGLEDNKTLKYNLPGDLAKRKLSYTFTNGILEVSLKK